MKNKTVTGGSTAQPVPHEDVAQPVAYIRTSYSIPTDGRDSRTKPVMQYQQEP